MKTINLTVSSRVQLSYNPDDKAFKQALERYVKEIDETATAQDMLEWVAVNVARWGCDEDIIGVGFVHDLMEHHELIEPWCGITVDSYDETASCHINGGVFVAGIENTVIAGDNSTINHVTIVEGE